jgi:hypothetical protein
MLMKMLHRSVVVVERTLALVLSYLVFDFRLGIGSEMLMKMLHCSVVVVERTLALVLSYLVLADFRLAFDSELRIIPRKRRLQCCCSPLGPLSM